MSSVSWTAVDWSRHVHEAHVDGRRVSYADYGSGPTVLLIHGMAGSWRNWLLNVPTLARDQRVIAVDLPGFGDSDALPRGAAFGQYVDVIAGLLDTLGIEDVAVVGHSFGGLVALSLAEGRPDRVAAVVLVAGGGVELSLPRLTAIRAAFALLHVLLLVPGAVRVLRSPRAARLLLAPIVHDTRSLPQDLLPELMPRSVGRGFMDAVRLGSERLGSLDLRSVSARVLLIWGRADRILPLEVGRRLAFGLAKARLVVLEDVGHCPMLEQPERCNQVMGDFLAGFRRPEGLASQRPGAAWSRVGRRRKDLDRGEWCGDGTAG